MFEDVSEGIFRKMVLNKSEGDKKNGKYPACKELKSYASGTYKRQYHNTRYSNSRYEI